jgi:hypothetical protein
MKIGRSYILFILMLISFGSNAQLKIGNSVLPVDSNQISFDTNELTDNSVSNVNLIPALNEKSLNANYQLIAVKSNRNLNVTSLMDSVCYKYDMSGNVIEKKQYFNLKYSTSNLFYQKDVSTYDNQNNLVSVVYSAFDTTTNTEKIGGRALLTYNALNSITSLKFQIWDTLNSIFITNTHDTSVYSTTNQLLSKNRFIRSMPNGLLISDNRDTYYYTVQDFFKYSLHEVYDTTIGSFKFFSMDTCIVDSAGKLLLAIRKGWNPIVNAFKNVSKTTYTYNTNSKVTSRIYAEWNNTSNSFLNKYCYKFTHDSSSNVTNTLYQIWINNSFVNKLKIDNTYNSFNSLTSSLTQHWDTITNLFHNSYGEIRNYNAINNLISYVRQQAVQPNYILIDVEKNIFTYDANDNLDTIFSSTRNSVTNLFEITGIYKHYYQSVIGIQKVGLVTKNEVSISPNPFTLETTVQFIDNQNKISVNIFDQKGNKISTKNSDYRTNNLKIQGGNFKSGTYIFEIVTDTQRFFKKVIALDY